MTTTDTARHTSPDSDLTTSDRELHQNALGVAQSAFHDLITGSSPLSLDGSALECGLPARNIDLAELRDLLLNPGSGAEVRDLAWAELVHRSRVDGPDWVIGCLGVAMPGLTSIANRVLSTSPADLAHDIVSEMVTEFVAQLARIDTTRPYIAARLLLWANKAALRVRNREIRRRVVENESITTLTTTEPIGEPEDVLDEAVRKQVITREAAEVIRATRLEGVRLTAYARGIGIKSAALDSKRRRAETRLASAIMNGQVSAKPFGSVTDLAL
jgi:predicted DNA-binding protein (UPF0251 family)